MKKHRSIGFIFLSAALGCLIGNAIGSGNSVIIAGYILLFIGILFYSRSWSNKWNTKFLKWLKMSR